MSTNVSYIHVKTEHTSAPASSIISAAAAGDVVIITLFFRVWELYRWKIGIWVSLLFDRSIR
jgi:hypothetical protein